MSSVAVSTDRPSALKTAIAGSIALAVAMGFGRFSYTLILPGMMDGLGLSAAQVSWIASANYFGYLAGAILAGYGWAAGHERRLAVGSIVATALLLLAMALTTNVPAFLVIRFLAGVASGFAMVFTTAIVLSHGIAHGNRHVQAAHFGGVGLGIALSSVMVGVFTVWHSGWTGGWIGGFVLSLIGAAVVQLFLPAEPVATGAPKREPPLVWTRDFAATTVAYGIFGFGYIITATFLVEIVHDGNGGNAFEAFVWCVTGLAAAPSVAYWMPAVRRIGLARTFVVGCGVEAVGVAASVLVPLPAGPVIGGILLGGTFIMVTAYGLQIGRALAPESPRRALAVMTAAFGIGQIIGPIVAGYLAEWTGSFTLASLAAAAGLVASACTILTVRRL
ncbi:MAG TPA: YbfB/YjiJ family MFS transporter [Pararhizobium sp.]|nr:YbfB/YjiJ family MFS transporter [Pararhizobium sp.]